MLQDAQPQPQPDFPFRLLRKREKAAPPARSSTMAQTRIVPEFAQSQLNMRTPPYLTDTALVSVVDSR